MRQTAKYTDDWIATRQSLLSRLRDWDDRDSWEHFFNTYWKLIYNIARKSGLTEVEAQEVVQETIIQVAKKIPEFKYDRSKGSFKGWLLKTTQWKIGDQFRKRGNAVPLVNQSEEEILAEPDNSTGQPLDSELASEWDRLWEKNLLETAIEKVKGRVDPREFQIFDLLVRREWPAAKIAEKFKVTRARIYYTKYKISRVLRRQIEKLG